MTSLLALFVVAALCDCGGRVPQVFTDIDDTFTSPSIATRDVGGGESKDWARNQALPPDPANPGIAAFEVALSKGVQGLIAGAGESENGAIVLSSRPDDLGIQAGMYKGSAPDVALVAAHGVGLRGALYGSIVADIADKQQRYLNFGNEKASSFNNWVSSQGAAASNLCFLFVGDNGQGDVLAGQQILENANSAAIFIHTVQLSGAQLQLNTSGSPFYYYFSTVGAAIQARCAGLLSLNGVKFVRDSVRASAQRAACVQSCSPSCVLGVCVDGDCQADPSTGYPPGCPDLLCDLAIADQFLASGGDSCASTVPLVDATPDYALGVGQQRLRSCAAMAAALSYEQTQSANMTFLADPFAFVDDSSLIPAGSANSGGSSAGGGGGGSSSSNSGGSNNRQDAPTTLHNGAPTSSIDVVLGAIASALVMFALC